MLPPTFALNVEAFADVLGLDLDLPPLAVPGRLYLDALANYAFALKDARFEQPGDTHFAWLVPEPAFEDLDLVARLLTARVLSRRFVLCALMVDFPNPVFSASRSRLLDYCPLTVPPGENLDQHFASAVANSAGGDAEREFLALWRMDEAALKQHCSDRIQEYWNAVARRLPTADGFDGYVRLAESRRRDARKRPLIEFTLTFPATNIPASAPPLEMREDGSVQARGTA